MNRAIAKSLLAIIRVYKLTLSPLLIGSCRFAPSCSSYAAEAVDTHGAIRGGWLAIRRMVQCRPFGRSGYDPVPKHSTFEAPHTRQT